MHDERLMFEKQDRWVTEMRKVMAVVMVVVTMGDDTKREGFNFEMRHMNNQEISQHPFVSSNRVLRIKIPHSFNISGWSRGVFSSFSSLHSLSRTHTCTKGGKNRYILPRISRTAVIILSFRSFARNAHSFT